MKNRIFSKYVNGIVALDRAELPVKELIPRTVRTWLARRLLAIVPPSVNNEPFEYEQFKFYAPNSFVSRANMAWDNDVIQHALADHLRPGMHVLDVGANIGLHTVFAAVRVGNTGKVYAVEPIERNLDLLKKNIDLNRLDNVEILPYAAGSSGGVQEMFIRGRTGDMSSLYQEHYADNTSEIVQVNVAPLDELVREPVHFIKIDVEGAEIEALQGMSRLLRSSRPLKMIVEWNVSLQKSAGFAPDSLPRFLIDEGFELYILEHKPAVNRDLQSLQALVPEYESTPKRPINIYAVRGDL